MEFNIHGILEVRTNIDIGIPTFFKVGNVDHPDLTINVGDFYFKETGNKTMYYRQKFFGSLTSKFLLKNLPGQTRIDAITMRYRFLRRLSRSCTKLIDDAMQLKLLQKEYSFVHSACLSRGSEGILLVATQNVGKTFTTISLVKNYGFSFLSDDFTIVGRNKAYCYPKQSTILPLHVKAHNIKLSKKKYIKMRINHLLSPYFGPLLFSPFTYGLVLEPQEVIKDLNIEKTARVNKICLLEVGSERVKEIDAEVALKKLLASTRQTLCPYGNILILSYAYADLSFDLDEFMVVEKKIFETLTENASCFVLRCKDKRYDKLILKHILD